MYQRGSWGLRFPQRAQPYLADLSGLRLFPHVLPGGCVQPEMVELSARRRVSPATHVVCPCVCTVGAGAFWTAPASFPMAR